ncbi:MAG: inositol monophosphatase family protein [Dermatophilus congolensis]|nr:inositol monophosphatase family protein [Dermatophilus congolensis]
MQHAHVPDPDTLARLEEFAVDIAASAGRLVREQRPDRFEIDTKSSDTDVVTQMDTAAQQYLEGRIRAEYAADGFLGEEEGGRIDPGTSGLTWVLDPIDGTVNYLYGRVDYAVSVAVVVGDVTTPGAWSPVVAAVAAPARGEVYHARLGGGARLRDAEGRTRTLTISRDPQLSHSLVATGFGYRADVRERQAGVVAALLPQVRDLRRAGSAALDACAVGSGELDAYYERGVHAWDIAGAWLVAAEAGAVVTGIASAAPLADGILVAPPRLHGDMREALLAAQGADDGVMRSASPVDE